MKREIFIEAIEAVEKQIRENVKVGKSLAAAFPNARTADLMPDNHLLGNVLIKILQAEMNDNDVCQYGLSWIEWFCFETNFGNESWRLKAYNKDKSIIPMDNAGELYDYLNNC
jgi:hypothetical protein